MIKPFILWGGTDINPQIYFEEPLPTTDKPDTFRDRQEQIEIVNAINNGRSIIGICRGAQLLCAMNGGKLHQHVPEHKNNNHPIFTYDSKIIHNVAADHHQVMIPAGDYIVHGTAYHHWKPGDVDYVPEIVWWHETKCLAVQPHPEWMPSNHPFNVWLNKLLFKLNIDYSF